jgi:hypothetical protein
VLTYEGQVFPSEEKALDLIIYEGQVFPSGGKVLHLIVYEGMCFLRGGKRYLTFTGYVFPSPFFKGGLRGIF